MAVSNYVVIGGNAYWVEDHENAIIGGAPISNEGRVMFEEAGQVEVMEREDERIVADAIARMNAAIKHAVRHA